MADRNDRSEDDEDDFLEGGSDTFINIKKMEGDTRIPAIVRQVARDIQRADHATAGKIFQQMSEDDLKILEREWTLLISQAAQSQIPIFRFPWFHHVTLMAEMIVQAETCSGRSKKSFNPGVNASLFMLFVALFLGTYREHLEIRDVRKLSLSPDSLRNLDKDMFKVLSPTGEDMVGHITKACQVLGRILDDMGGGKVQRSSDERMKYFIDEMEKAGFGGKYGAMSGNFPGVPPRGASMLGNSFSNPDGDPPSEKSPGLKGLEDRLKGMLKPPRKPE